MMQNRLYLSNYLLSGDIRESDHMTEGVQPARAEQTPDVWPPPTNNARSGEGRTDGTELGPGLCQPADGKTEASRSGKLHGGRTANFLSAKRCRLVGEELDRISGHGGPGKASGCSKSGVKVTIPPATGRSWIALLSTLVALMLGIGIAFRTAKSITEPLNDLMKVTQADRQRPAIWIMRSTSSARTKSGNWPELSPTWSSYLREMAAVSEAIAGGNLSVEVQPRSKNDTLGNAFVRMVEGLRSLVRNVRDAASQVASASSQVAGASDESAKISLQTSSAIDEVTSTMHEMSVNVQNMVKSTQMQASSVSETSASIDQMVASIQRVADTAKVLLDISNRSREEVHSGINTMEKATDGLNKINITIRSSGEIIDVLGQRADDIGKIIEVIDDLAEQTNLLALNAAIEAARAGEHGLGFAVVADEVSKLAEKSAQSTKEISELIQSIQKEARKAVENMDRSTGIVNDGLGLGQELNGALRKISNVVTEVYKFAQEIGAATNEQSHGSSQIARATTRLNEITHEINSAVEEQASGAQAVVKAMERMRELVQQTTSGSTELAASAEQMSKMSRELLDSMHRFALEQTERVPTRS